MLLPVRVEDRVSIVGMCTPVLGLKNLEVGPVQTLGPLLYLHQLFPTLLPWFRPTLGSATSCGSSVDPPSQNLSQNRQYRNTVTCLPTHTGQSCLSCEGPNNLSHKWQYRDTALTNTHNKRETTNDAG